MNIYNTHMSNTAHTFTVHCNFMQYIFYITLEYIAQKSVGLH